MNRRDCHAIYYCHLFIYSFTGRRGSYIDNYHNQSSLSYSLRGERSGSNRALRCDWINQDSHIQRFDTYEELNTPWTPFPLRTSTTYPATSLISTEFT